MEVIVGRYAGFCGGVKQAVEKTEKSTYNYKDIYCLGEVVHNKQVIENLEKNGLKIVNSIDEIPSGSKMIIRAHGEREETYLIALERKIEIIDTTCIFVETIHKKVKKAREDSFIIIIGERKHPEIIGTSGFAGENYYIIEEENDILQAYLEYEKTNLDKVYVCSQTTYNSKKFDYFIQKIKEKFLNTELTIDKTICNSTELRQKECEELLNKVDAMVIIGGKNSSNTKKLVEITKKGLEKVFWIQTVEDLRKISLNEINKIGILAGASTPDYIIEEVRLYIEKNNI